MFRFALTVVLATIAGPCFLLAQSEERGGISAEKPGLERPLAPGAISRLGTTLYRAEGEIKGLTFLADNRTMVTSAGWYDVETGAKINEFDPQQGRIDRLEVSQDRTRIVTVHGQYDAERFVGKHWIVCWDAKARIVWESQEFPAGVAALAIAPDASVVVTAGSEGVQFWDGETGAPMGEPRKIRDEIRKLQFSADGALLMVWAADDEALVWNWRDGAEPTTLFEKEDRERLIAVSPTDLTVISAKYGELGFRLIDLVDPTISRLVGELLVSNFQAEATFSADGKLLIIELPSRSIELWDIITNKRLRVFDDLPIDGGRTVTSPDGRWMAKAESTGAIIVRGLQKAKRIPRPDGHEASVSAMSFFPDGKRFVSGGEDGTVRLWDIESGRQLHVMHHENDERWNAVRAVAVSSDGRLIASSGTDNAVRLWDSETGGEQRVLAGNGTRLGSRWLAFAKNEPRLYAWGEGEMLRVWDLSSGKALAETQISVADNSNIDSESVGLLDGGKRFFVVYGPTKHVFDLPSGVETETVDGWYPDAGFAPQADRAALLIPGPNIVRELPDGRQLVSGSKDHTLEIRALSSGEILHRIPVPQGYWCSPVMSLDGRLIVIRRAIPSGPMLIFDSTTGEITHRLDNYRIGGGHAVFSPDNQRLAVARGDTTIDIWDVEKLRVPAQKTP